jgi:hypothetical protein
MSLSSELRADQVAESRAKAELLAVQAELRAARIELARSSVVDDLVGRFNPQLLTIPDWTVKPSRTGGHVGIATLQFSDAHFDEVVDPFQMDGYNAYNREIAGQRLRLLAEKTITVARTYMGGVKYDGLVVLSTGDTFSGDIHEELRRTNEADLYASAVYWVGHVARFLEVLADDFGRVHVGCVVGNHGRNEKKPVFKNRVTNNIEWLFWHYVADLLAAKGDERITFDISDGIRQQVSVYDTTYSIEHGDTFKGGSGIAGARSPLLLGQHRAAVQAIAMGQPMDWMVVGHFHQYQPPSQGLIMGGSLKGYDEYAAGLHLRPEQPQQGLWITTPERGPTVFAPIQPMNREAEGW